MEQNQAAVTIQGMIHSLQHELINVFDLDATPLETYLKSYQRTVKFIMRDMQAVAQNTDSDFMRVFFDNIIARADSSLIKQAVTRVDSYYANITMEDQDKLVEEIFAHEDKDKDGLISHEEFSGPKHDEL